MTTQKYMKKRKKFSGLFVERALPNEYLVAVGKKSIKPILGGKKFKLFQKFLRVPAYVQKLTFITDNANIDYQGIGLEGYASWRINPGDPTVSISTLDFFDENDPMAKTNEDLKTICIEAVRHVISNMTIEQALKNKDDIAENLKKQLLAVEKKWGIVFDQVGIEKVKIMSNNLFTDLQSEFRNKLRLESSTISINTNREIAKEENTANEKTQLEQIATQQKIELIQVDNNIKIREKEIEQNQNIANKERKIREENFRNEQTFNMEKEEKNYELETLQKNLELKLLESEQENLKSKLNVEKLKNNISEKQIEIDKLRKKLDQIYSNEELTSQLIENLPQIFESINIDNYSVLDSGGNGKSISPVTKILNELMFALKNNDFSFGKSKKTDKKPKKV